MTCAKYETNKQAIDYLILFVPTLQHNFPNNPTLNDRIRLKPGPYNLDNNLLGIIVSSIAQNKANLLIQLLFIKFSILIKA